MGACGDSRGCSGGLSVLLTCNQLELSARISFSIYSNYSEIAEFLAIISAILRLSLIQLELDFVDPKITNLLFMSFRTLGETLLMYTTFPRPTFNAQCRAMLHVQ
jgi:hypothetical protein